MSYQGQETSIESGRPVELYLFQNEGVVSERFAYTSGPLPITHNTITYEPRVISRTGPKVEQSSPGVDKGIEITMPADDPLALRYAPNLPPKRDIVTIFRQHASDGATPETIAFYKGYVSSVGFNDDATRAVVKVAPIATLLSRNCPKRQYRGLCTHVLYDSECKINPVDPSFKFDVTVTAVSSDGTVVTVTGAGIGGKAADFFDGGMLRRAAPADRRMVLDFVETTTDTGTCKLLLGFPSLTVGAALTLHAGCDHTITTCRTKFANEVNFGGFPWVPTRNPFDTGIIT